MRPGLTVVAGLEYFGRSRRGAAAWSDGTRTLTFGDVDQRSTRGAQALVRLGIRPGDRIMILLENQLRSAEVYAAVAKAGAVMIPVNSQSTRAEIARMASLALPAGIITQSRFAENRDAVEEFSSIPTISVDRHDGCLAWDEIVDEAGSRVPLPTLKEDDVFSISFTGGTTGRPKGVMISHRSRALTFSGMSAEFGLGPGRRTINTTPLSHGAGFAYGFGFMVAGAHVVTMPRWDPEQLLTLMAAHRPHQLFLVPSQLSDLRDLGTAGVRKAGFHELPQLFVSAAPLPDDLKEWFIADFPEVTFADVYGGTEAGVVSVVKTPDLQIRGRTVGTPWLMTEVRILDSDKNPVPLGASGDLYSRSPYVFSGYLDDPEQTEAVMTADGFVTAGDVAIQDDDGFLYIVDRSKDMIISGGVNVYPREVEEVLLLHPTVADAAVVGIPHPRWGEEVVAIVVSFGDAAIDIQALRDHCSTSLAGYKVPKRIALRPSLDRTSMGKITKSDLRDWVIRELGQNPENS